MDYFEEDDIFDFSDIEISNDLPSSCNPVDEYLIKQLNDVHDRIARVKNEATDVQSTAEKILTKLYKQCTYVYDSESSDADDDWYDENCKPIIKRKKLYKTQTPLLVATDVWQRIVDDKWVIGVNLQKNCNRLLEAPRFYVMVENQNELQGVTALWEINNDGLWTRIENLNSNSEKIAATAVLNLPNFQNISTVTAYGTIIYQIDGKELQAATDAIELCASEAVDKLLMPRYAPNLCSSILAVKATAFDKILTISLNKESGRGAKLLNFLESKNFLQVLPDIYISKNPETFRNCILEILSFDDTAIKLQISAKSMAHLNIIMHMVGEEFPDLTETAREDKIIDGVIALKQELQLKLECDEPICLMKARIITDLLVP